jgi:hypothetical protein
MKTDNEIFASLSHSSCSSDSFSDYEVHSQDELDISQLEESQEKDKSSNQIGNNIICIELMNNNKIYLNYSPQWKVRDVRENYL